MNNNINKSSSPTQPTLSSNNSTPPPPPSTQQQPTLKDHVIQSMREVNGNAPTYNISNNTTDNNNPVILQREEGVDNINTTDKLEGGDNTMGKGDNKMATNPTNTVRRRTSVLEAASTLASFSTTGALPSSTASLPPASTSPSLNNAGQQSNTLINKAPSSAMPTYRPSALPPTLTHNYTGNNNQNQFLNTQQQGSEKGGWGSEDYEQIGQTKIRVLDAPHTVTGVYGNRNSLLGNLAGGSHNLAAARGGGSYEELNKHLGELDKQLGEYANNYNHRGELMNNYGGESPRGQGSNNLLMNENSLMVEGMRARGGKDLVTGIRPPPSLTANHLGVGGERDEKEEEVEVMDDEGNIINAPPGHDVPLTFPQKVSVFLNVRIERDKVCWGLVFQLTNPSRHHLLFFSYP